MLSSSRPQPALPCIALGACALVLAFCADPASAATFPAACSGTTGDPDSLVSAINSANASSGPDSVRLGAGCTYTLHVQDNGWYGPNDLPAISSGVTIEGNGATITRRADAPNARFFFVGADPAATSTLNYVTPGAGRLTLRDVTLKGGHVKGGSASAGGGGAGLGGAIFNQGRLVIEDSTLTGNIAEGGEGGGTEGSNPGGGMGTDSNVQNAGGMGLTEPPGASKGGGPGPAGGGAGGGAGFRVGEDGGAGGGTSGSPGGGPASGTAGQGGSGVRAGDGGGGGGDGNGSGTGAKGGIGGDFGQGGTGLGGVGQTSGGGGGVGGGGGSSGGLGATGGGGGFGGGGGWGIAGGGTGGFGGGAGSHGGSGTVGAPGFGGGAARDISSGGGAGAGMGGAVFNMQGTVTVRNSTLAVNTAQGGESNGSPDPGKGLGGAVFNLNGSFSATGSTLAANSAVPNTTIAEGTAIYNLAYDASEARTAQVTLRDTILGAGTGDDTLVSNRSDYITPSPNLGTADAAIGERNLVASSTAVDGGTVTGTASTADPLLGPLGDNGGPTQTMAPAPNSPAVDAGAAFVLTRDQRGFARPSDFPAIPNLADGSDIGAVELQAPLPSFGSRTRVSLRLAARRIRSRGPVPVRVHNGNTFAVKGRLGGRTTARFRTRRGGSRHFVKLSSSRTFTVRAGAHRTVKLKLPRFLRRRLARTGRLSLRVAARVQDPAGHTRTVAKRIKPRLKR